MKRSADPTLGASEPVDGPNASLQKKPRHLSNRRRQISLVFTSIPAAYSSKIQSDRIEALLNLDGSDCRYTVNILMDEIDSSAGATVPTAQMQALTRCTHLVSGAVGNRVRKTLKVLFAIARGAWFLSLRWLDAVLDCLNGADQPGTRRERLFQLLLDPITIRTEEGLLLDHNIKAALKSKQFHMDQDYTGGLFSGIRCHVVDGVTPRRELMEALLEAAGGEICTNDRNVRSDNVHVIIASKTLVALDGHLISESIPIVTEKWVLTCLLEQYALVPLSGSLMHPKNIHTGTMIRPSTSNNDMSRFRKPKALESMSPPRMVKPKSLRCKSPKKTSVDNRLIQSSSVAEMHLRLRLVGSLRDKQHGDGTPITSPVINIDPSCSSAILGRSSSMCDHVIGDLHPIISRQHASIARTIDGNWSISDRSANGIFVNKIKVQEAILRNGDLITFGGGANIRHGTVCPKIDSRCTYIVDLVSAESDTTKRLEKSEREASRLNQELEEMRKVLLEKHMQEQKAGVELSHLRTRISANEAERRDSEMKLQELQRQLQEKQDTPQSRNETQNERRIQSQMHEEMRQLEILVQQKEQQHRQQQWQLRTLKRAMQKQRSANHMPNMPSTSTVATDLSEIASTKRVVIVDTNIIINHPSLFERIKKDVLIVVPFIVIQELDGLKNASSELVASSAKRAIRCLQEQLSNGNERIRGQLAHEELSRQEGGLYDPWDGALNDDKILSCALFFAKHVGRVILCTCDRNLSTKGMVYKLNCSSDVSEYVHGANP